MRPVRATSRYLNHLADQYAERSIAREKEWVTRGHDSVVRTYRGAAWRGLLGVAAIFAASWLDDDPLSTLPFVVLGWSVGQMALTWVVRASAYRSGWLDGRQRMAQQMRNHDRLEDWMRVEFDHDSVHVLGMPPLPPEGGHR